MDFRKFVFTFFILLAPNLISAQIFNEFDGEYKVYSGLSNSDQLTDLLVARTFREIVFLHGGITVPIDLTPVDDFILQNNGDGSFEIVESAVINLDDWQEVDVSTRLFDFNLDGSKDLILNGVSSVIDGAFNQIIYSPTQSNQIPSSMTSVNESFISFFQDMMRWIVDRDFFSNPPLLMSTAPDIETLRFAFEAAVSPVFIGQLLATCGDDCIITTTPPVDNCIITTLVSDVDRYGNVFNERLEVRNICVDFQIFIVEVEEGEVEFTPDFSVFDQLAREVGETINRINANCPGTINDQDGDTLTGAAGIIIGSLEPLVGEFINSDNSIPHPEFPSAGIFDESDATFHHYDVSTKLCGFEEPGCDPSFASAGVVITGRYTLPSLMLEATNPRIDGSFETAYAPNLTALFSSPSPADYTLAIGRVTQQFLPSVDTIENGERYFRTVQNITDALHAVFPGTISRTLEIRPDGIYGFTHGVGLNRGFCSNYLDADGLSHIGLAIKYIQVIGAFANDAFGFQAFQNLDRNLRAEFRRELGFSVIEIPTLNSNLLPTQEVAEMAEMKLE